MSSYDDDYDIDLCRYYVGIGYVLYGFVGILINLVVFVAIIPMSKNFFAFRILLHAIVANVALILIVGIWGGIVLIVKSDLLTGMCTDSAGVMDWECKFMARRIFNIVCYIFWWSSLYFSIYIVFTRLVCVLRPNKIINFHPYKSHIICGIIWFIAVVQSVSITNIQGYALIYFDPYTIGFEISNEYYLGFTGKYYIGLTYTCLLAIFMLYFFVGFILFVQSKMFRRFMNIPLKQEDRNMSMGTVAFVHNRGPIKMKKSTRGMVKVEKSLIFPYFMQEILAIFAQVCIIVPIPLLTDEILTYLLLISQYIIGPLLLILTSDKIRNQLVMFFNWVFKRNSKITKTPVTKF